MPAYPGHGPAADLHQCRALRRQHPDPAGSGLLTPYKITAVGDPDSLKKALDNSPAIQNYLLYVKAYGLGWKVDEREAVTLPGYSGTVDLHYAKPVK